VVLASLAKRDCQALQWRTNASPSSWSDPNLMTHVAHQAVALQLHEPAKSQSSEFEGRSARCQVTSSAKVVHDLNEPAMYDKDEGGFRVLFPQQFDNDAKHDPGKYDVIWYSDVLEEPRSLQFTVDRMGRVDSEKSIT
jgi:hypothetical protein